jgi:integrase
VDNDTKPRPRARKGDGSVFTTTDGRHRASLSVRDVVTGKPRRVWFSGKTPSEVRRKMQAARTEAVRIGATPTVADYGTQWLQAARHRVRPATMQGYRSGIAAATRGVGTVELGRLRPADVEAWMGAELAAGKKPGTVTHYRRCLALALADAERDGLVTRNAARLARPPRRSEAPPRALSADERARLVAAAQDDPAGPLVLLALSTGLRRGELLALRWEDIGPDSLRVTGALAVGPQGGHIRTEPKTRRSRRTVGLPAMARGALDRQRAAVGDSAWVFPSGTGKPMDPRTAGEAFRALATRAGLPSDVRLHDMRHTAATLALGAGVPVRDVADALGHSSPTITLNVYSHSIPEGPSRVTAALDKALGGES